MVYFYPLYVFLGISSSLMANNKFSVTIKFPTGFDFTKLNVAYDNGKSQINIKLPPIKNSSIIVSGEYYSLYAAIILQYPKSKNFNYRNSLFLTQKPGQITFIKSDTISSPFDNYTLVNVDDFKDEKDKMKQNNSIEVKEIEDLILSLGDSFSKVFEDSTELNKSWVAKNRTLFAKDIEYVFKTSASYYSFCFFRRNLSHPNFISADSAVRFFTTTLLPKFINSTEGNTILSLISGDQTVKKGSTAPDFVCKDATGNTVSLKNYRQKKYVLLTFWATWCGHCLEEIPIILKIRDTYNSNVLEIIGISGDTDYSKFYETLISYKMNWIHIFHDEDIIKNMGTSLSLPSI